MNGNEFSWSGYADPGGCALVDAHALRADEWTRFRGTSVVATIEGLSNPMQR
jgi:hypothetical protein